MSLPAGAQPPPLTKNSTFGQVVDWINYKAPGYGQVFIDWVQKNAKITPPESDTIDLSSRTFGTPKPPPSPPGNTAVDWFAAWLLLGNVGPGIGKAIQIGVGSLGQLAEQGLTGTAKGVGQVTPQATFSNFLSGIEQGATWVRVVEVILGIGLLIVGVAALNAGPVSAAAGKIASKAGLLA